MKKGSDTLSRETTLSKRFCPFWKVVYSNRICLPWEQILSFWNRPRFKLGLVYRKAISKSNVVSFVQSGWKIYQAYRFPYIFMADPINSLMALSYEPQRAKTTILIRAPNEDSNQPSHPRSLIRVFIVRMKKLCILGYQKCAQWRVCSDCANAQVDLNFCCAHIPKVRFQIRYHR